MDSPRILVFYFVACLFSSKFVFSFCLSSRDRPGRVCRLRQLNLVEEERFQLQSWLFFEKQFAMMNGLFRGIFLKAHCYKKFQQFFKNTLIGQSSEMTENELWNLRLFVNCLKLQFPELSNQEFRTVLSGEYAKGAKRVLIRLLVSNFDIKLQNERKWIATLPNVSPKVCEK